METLGATYFSTNFQIWARFFEKIVDEDESHT